MIFKKCKNNKNTENKLLYKDIDCNTDNLKGLIYPLITLVFLLGTVGILSSLYHIIMIH